MPKGFSQREKEIIHARLIRNGQEFFETHGVRKTNIEELTRSVGISKGAFYLFYPSKEALFFEILERYEADFRKQMLATQAHATGTPRERVRQVLEKAFTAWKTIPLFRNFDKVEYEYLLRKLPEETAAAHLRSDESFVGELIDTWRASGVPIQGEAPEISGLMKALFFVSLHAEDIGVQVYPATIQRLVDMVSASLTGEIAPETDIQPKDMA